MKPAMYRDIASLEGNWKFGGTTDRELCKLRNEVLSIPKRHFIQRAGVPAACCSSRGRSSGWSDGSRDPKREKELLLVLLARNSSQTGLDR